MDQENVQLVVGVTNHVTQEQSWFNEVRTRKPQTFKSDGGLLDPTDGGRNCDFCKWQELTAQDSWGRIERPHAVTGSNLFKYGEPCHGLVLFKHHNPLECSREQLRDFLEVSRGWFDAAAAAHPDARRPFFIWNCGARAGASQFHGHGQLMLTRVPVPAQARLDAAAVQHSALCASRAPSTSAAPSNDGGNGSGGGSGGGGSGGYFADLVRAHHALGLARELRVGCETAHVLLHIAPIKDMEVLVLGRDLASPAFVDALHAALRALVDGLGVSTFNLGMLNVPLQPGGDSAAAVAAAADAACGSGSSSSSDVGLPPLDVTVSGSGQRLTLPGAEGSAAGAGADGSGGGGGDDPGWRPLVARLVSRGKPSAPASDYGCLEVLGGASIGHTDPYTVAAALDRQLAAAAAARAAAAAAATSAARSG